MNKRVFVLLLLVLLSLITHAQVAHSATFADCTSTTYTGTHVVALYSTDPPGSTWKSTTCTYDNLNIQLSGTGSIKANVQITGATVVSFYVNANLEFSAGSSFVIDGMTVSSQFSCNANFMESDFQFINSVLGSGGINLVRINSNTLYTFDNLSPKTYELTLSAINSAAYPLLTGSTVVVRNSNLKSIDINTPNGVTTSLEKTNFNIYSNTLEQITLGSNRVMGANITISTNTFLSLGSSSIDLSSWTCSDVNGCFTVLDGNSMIGPSYGLLMNSLKLGDNSLTTLRNNYMIENCIQFGQSSTSTGVLDYDFASNTCADNGRIYIAVYGPRASALVLTMSQPLDTLTLQLFTTARSFVTVDGGNTPLRYFSFSGTNFDLTVKDALFDTMYVNQISNGNVNVQGSQVLSYLTLNQLTNVTALFSEMTFYASLSSSNWINTNVTFEKWRIELDTKYFNLPSMTTSTLLLKDSTAVMSKYGRFDQSSLMQNSSSIWFHNVSAWATSDQSTSTTYALLRFSGPSYDYSNVVGMRDSFFGTEQTSGYILYWYYVNTDYRLTLDIGPSTVFGNGTGYINIRLANDIYHPLQIYDMDVYYFYSVFLVSGCQLDLVNSMTQSTLNVANNNNNIENVKFSLTGGDVAYVLLYMCSFQSEFTISDVMITSLTMYGSSSSYWNNFSTVLIQNVTVTSTVTISSFWTAGNVTVIDSTIGLTSYGWRHGASDKDIPSTYTFLRNTFLSTSQNADFNSINWVGVVGTLLLFEENLFYNRGLALSVPSSNDGVVVARFRRNVFETSSSCLSVYGISLDHDRSNIYNSPGRQITITYYSPTWFPFELYNAEIGTVVINTNQAASNVTLFAVNTTASSSLQMSTSAVGNKAFFTNCTTSNLVLSLSNGESIQVVAENVTYTTGSFSTAYSFNHSVMIKNCTGERFTMSGTYSKGGTYLFDDSIFTGRSSYTDGFDITYDWWNTSIIFQNNKIQSVSSYGISANSYFHLHNTSRVVFINNTMSASSSALYVDYYRTSDPRYTSEPGEGTFYFRNNTIYRTFSMTDVDLIDFESSNVLLGTYTQMVVTTSSNQTTPFEIANSNFYGGNLRFLNSNQRVFIRDNTITSTLSFSTGALSDNTMVEAVHNTGGAFSFVLDGAGINATMMYNNFTSFAFPSNSQYGGGRVVLEENYNVPRLTVQMNMNALDLLIKNNNFYTSTSGDLITWSYNNMINSTVLFADNKMTQDYSSSSYAALSYYSPYSSVNSTLTFLRNDFYSYYQIIEEYVNAAYRPFIDRESRVIFRENTFRSRCTTCGYVRFASQVQIDHDGSNFYDSIYYVGYDQAGDYSDLPFYLNNSQIYTGFINTRYANYSHVYVTNVTSFNAFSANFATSSTYSTHFGYALFDNCTGGMSGNMGYSTSTTIHIRNTQIDNANFNGVFSDNATLIMERCTRRQSRATFTLTTTGMKDGRMILRNNVLGAVYLNGVSDSSSYHPSNCEVHLHNNDIQQFGLSQGIWDMTVNIYDNVFNLTDTSSDMIYWSQMGLQNSTFYINNNTFDSLPYFGYYNYRNSNIELTGSTYTTNILANSSLLIHNNIFYSYGISCQISGNSMKGQNFYVQYRSNIFRPYSSGSYYAMYYGVSFSNDDSYNTTVDYDGSNVIEDTGSYSQWSIYVVVYEAVPFYPLEVMNSFVSLSITTVDTRDFTVFAKNCTIVSGSLNVQNSNNTKVYISNSSMNGGTLNLNYASDIVFDFRDGVIGSHTVSGTSSTFLYNTEFMKNISIAYINNTVTGSGININGRLNETTMTIANNTFVSGSGDSVYFQSSSRVDNSTFWIQNNSFLGSGMVRIYRMYQGTDFYLNIFDNYVNVNSYAFELTYTYNFDPYDYSHHFVFRRNNFSSWSVSTSMFTLTGPDCDFDESNVAAGGTWTYTPEVREPRVRFTLSNSLIYAFYAYATDGWNADHLIYNTTATSIRMYPRTSVNATMTVENCTVLSQLSAYFMSGNMTTLDVQTAMVGSNLYVDAALQSFGNSFTTNDVTLTGRITVAQGDYLNTTIDFNNTDQTVTQYNQYFVLSYSHFTNSSLSLRNSIITFPVGVYCYGMYAYRSWFTDSTFEISQNSYQIGRVQSYYPIYFGGIYGQLLEGGLMVVRNNLFNSTTSNTVVVYWSYYNSVSYQMYGHLIYDETNLCLGCQMQFQLSGVVDHPPIVLSGGWFTTVIATGYGENRASFIVQNATVTSGVNLYPADSNGTIFMLDNVESATLTTSFTTTHNTRTLIHRSNITGVFSANGRGSTSYVPINTSMLVTETAIEQLSMGATDYDDLTFYFDGCNITNPSTSYALYMYSTYMYHFNVTFANTYFSSTAGNTMYAYNLALYEDATITFVNSTFVNFAGNCIQVSARSLTDDSWFVMKNTTLIGSEGQTAMSLGGYSIYYLNVRFENVGASNFPIATIYCNSISHLGFSAAELWYLSIYTYNNGNFTLLMDGGGAFKGQGLYLYPQVNLDSLNATIMDTEIISGTLNYLPRVMYNYLWLQLTNVSGMGSFQPTYTSCSSGSFCQNNYTILIDNSTLKEIRTTINSNNLTFLVHNSTIVETAIVYGFITNSSVATTFSTFRHLRMDPTYFTNSVLEIRSSNFTTPYMNLHTLELSTDFDGSEMLISHSAFKHQNNGQYGLRLPFTSGGRLEFNETNTITDMNVYVVLSAGLTSMDPSRFHIRNSSTNPSYTSTFTSNVNKTSFEASGSNLANWYLHSNAAYENFWFTETKGAIQFIGDTAASQESCILSYDATGLGLTIQNGLQMGGRYRFYRSIMTTLTFYRMYNINVSVYDCDFMGPQRHLAIMPASSGNYGRLSLIRSRFGVISGSEQQHLYLYSIPSRVMPLEIEIVGNTFCVTNDGQGVVVDGLMGTDTFMLMKENHYYSSVPCITCYAMLMGAGTTSWSLLLDGGTTSVQYAVNSFDFSGGMMLAGNSLRFMNMITSGSLTLRNARDFRIDLIASGGALTSLTIINGDNISVTGQNMNMSLYFSDLKNSKVSIGWGSPMAGVKLVGNMSNTTFSFHNSSIFGATELSSALFDANSGIWMRNMWMMQFVSTSTSAFYAGSTLSIEESQVVTFRQPIPSVEVSYILRDGSRFFFNRNRAITRNGYLSIDMYNVMNTSVVEIWGNEFHGSVTIYYQGTNQISIVNNVIYADTTFYGSYPTPHNFLYGCNSVNDDPLAISTAGWTTTPCTSSYTISRCGGTKNTAVTDALPSSCDEINVYPMVYPLPKRDRIVIMPLMQYGDCSEPTYRLVYFTHSESISISQTISMNVTETVSVETSPSASKSLPSTKSMPVSRTKSLLSTKSLQATNTVPMSKTYEKTKTGELPPTTTTTTTTTASTTTTTTTTTPNTTTTTVTTTSAPAPSTTTAAPPNTTSMTSASATSATCSAPSNLPSSSSTSGSTTSTTSTMLSTTTAPTSSSASTSSTSSPPSSPGSMSTTTTTMLPPASSSSIPPTTTMISSGSAAVTTTSTPMTTTSGAPSQQPSQTSVASSSTTTATTTTTAGSTNATTTTTTTTAPTTTTTTTPSTLAPGAAKPPCPVLTTLISPLGQLHDIDIQSSGIIINATAQGFATFKNFTTVELASLIVFELAEPSGEVDGFKTRFGAGPHYWCEMVGTQRINCMIPQDSGYKLLAKETITATILDTQSLYTNWTADQCTGQRVVMFREVIEPSTSLAAVEIAQSLAVVSGSGAIVVGALVGAAALDLQAIGVLFQSECSSTLDTRTGSPIKYFISPFYDTGVAGIIFGNLAFMILLSGVQFIVAQVIQRKRGIARVDAWAAVRFPSLSYGVVQLFYMGICVGTFMGLGSAEMGDVVVGVIGLVFSVAIPSLVVFVIYRVPEARFIQYTQFLSKKAYHRWLFPVGYWTPAAVSQSYRRLFGNMNRDRKYFCIMPMVVSFLASLAMFGLSSINCEVRLGMAAGVFFLAAAVTVISQFGRSICLTMLTFASYCMLGILAVLMMKSYSNPSQSLVSAKLAVCILQIMLVILIAAYQISTKVFEHKYWRKNRLTDLEAIEQDDMERMASRPMIEESPDTDANTTDKYGPRSAASIPPQNQNHINIQEPDTMSSAGTTLSESGRSVEMVSNATASASAPAASSYSPPPPPARALTATPSSSDESVFSEASEAASTAASSTDDIFESSSSAKSSGLFDESSEEQESDASSSSVF